MKDELVYVEHILACVGRIETYIRAELIAGRPPAVP